MRIAKANFSEYTLLDKNFAKFYGFTQAEVDELLTVVPTKTNPEEIKNWYNGYTFGGEIIYNPWSIMQCLAREGELDHYWLDSGGTNIIDKVFVSDEIQEDLTKLLEGEGIVKKLYKQISLTEIEDNQNIFYSLLLFIGYLNANLANDNKEDPRYCLTIPNKEVRNIYVERVIKWLTKKLTIKMNEYDNFINFLTNEQIDKFGEKLQEYLLRSTSYHDLIGGLLAPLVSQYMIESNKETGYGRYDHILIHKAISDFIKSEIASRNIVLTVLESTGGYERLVMRILQQAGLAVHRAHPNRVHAFAKVCNHFAKTDKLDALLLEKYAAFIANDEKGDQIISVIQEELQSLRSIERNIEEYIHANQCRTKVASEKAKKYLEEMIKCGKKQLKEIRRDIKAAIKEDKSLKAKNDLLISYKGIGEKTASVLLIELPELGVLSNKEIASLVGLVPKTS